MRAFAAISVVLLFLAAFVLYVFPADTDRFFAWTIRPTMTAMLMGAGYFAATYFFLRLLRERRWHRVALGFPSIIAFSVCMVIATALHWDRFNYEHPVFWIWVVGYAAAPFLVLGLWLINRRADAALEVDDVVIPSAFRVLLVIGGVGAVALAVVCVVAPGNIIPIWPWQLTPLTARVLGGWLSVPGLIALAIAMDGRWSAARYLIQCTIIGLVLMLVAIGRAGAEFEPGPGTSILIVGAAAKLGFSAALYLAMERRRRRVTMGAA